MGTIYGGQYNPFGSAPFGYDPNSQSSIISTGGLWPDDNTVFNLADPSGLVQSLSGTQSFLRNFNYNANSPYRANSSLFASANFYDNLLSQQAGMGNTGLNMNDMFSMMLMMRQLETLGKNNTRKPPEIDAGKRDINDIVSDNKVKDATRIKYDDGLKKYAEDEFADLKEDAPEDTNGKVLLKAALDKLGIGKLSDGASKALAKKLGYEDQVANYEDLCKLEVEDADKYQKLLEQVGFDADENYVTKETILENIEKMKSGKIIDEQRVESTALRAQFNSLERNLSITTPNYEDIENEIEELTSTKEKTKALFAKMKDDKDDLGLPKLLKALTKNDKDGGLKDFEVTLENLKATAEEHDLKDEWNALLEDINSDDKKAMKENLQKFDYMGLWGKAENIARKEKLDKILEESKIE